jgi:hypothetical protein
MLQDYYSLILLYVQKQVFQNIIYLFMYKMKYHEIEKLFASLIK